jgi:MSHA type pilus biogenesis protein MshL
MLLRILGATLTTLLLAACAPSTLSGGPSDGHLRAEGVRTTPGAIPQTVQQSVSLPKPKAAGKAETYSVVVNNVKVQDLLFALARDAKLNVDIHPGISGYVSMNAIDQTLPQLLNRIAKQVDMRFEMDGANLAVMPDTPYLKNYKIDYINMSRDVVSNMSTNTQISTSALTSTGSAGSGNTSKIQIENKSKNHFWESLEKNIKDILQDTDKEKIIARRTADSREDNNRSNNQSTSAKGSGAAAGSSGPGIAAAGVGDQNVESTSGANTQAQRQQDYKDYQTIFAASVISNPETGIISIRATSRQHEKVQEFIDRITGSASRQVLIEATIVEVVLSDGYQQGIDWKTTGNSGFSMTTLPATTSNVPSVVTPFLLRYLNPALTLTASLSMLQAFGTVKVLSSPKLTVLNNQSATLKVSEDIVYFKVEQTVVPAGPTTGAASATTTTPQSVSVGFFMSIFAQISETGVITLNVRPSISSVSKYVTDPNPALTGVTNQVPQIRTREMESVMRMGSGEIAVLGGLMEDRQDNKTGRFPIIGEVPVIGEIFNVRNNASAKTELVVFIRPTVIKDSSVEGDFSNFKDALPNKDFFKTDSIYKPFYGPNLEPLR